MSDKSTIRTSLIGFLASILLTLAAYFSVVEKLFESVALIYTIVGLALAQTVVQLICFLHLGEEDKPKLKLFVFYFMALVAVILVAGSLWIMFHLNERVMTMEMPLEGL